jgi:hypothetical protein
LHGTEELSSGVSGETVCMQAFDWQRGLTV